MQDNLFHFPPSVHTVLAVFNEFQAKADLDWQAMFGRRSNPPADECEIAFDNIPLEEKLKQLAILREAKAARKAARQTRRMVVRTTE